MSVPDDPERSPSDFVSTAGAFSPDAFVEFTASIPESSVEGHDLRDGEFGDAAGVGEWSVEHREPPSCRVPKIELVGADAEATDRHQAGVPIKQGRRKP